MRLVEVRGRWSINIRMAYWEILYRGESMATSASSVKNVAMAARLLEGQKLVDVAVHAKNGATSFAFDLGGVLKVRRMEAVGTDAVWILWKKNCNLVIVYGDGSSRYGRSSEPCE